MGNEKEINTFWACIEMDGISMEGVGLILARYFDTEWEYTFEERSIKVTDGNGRNWLAYHGSRARTILETPNLYFNESDIGEWKEIIQKLHRAGAKSQDAEDGFVCNAILSAL